jgi:acyl carrier protein
VAATKAINNSPILFCWVVIQPGKDISEVNLLSHLKGLLPDYMIPKNIFFIEELPLTLNGKVNIEALNISTTYKKNKKLSPNNPLEKTVLMVWVNVLKNIDIGVDDDFIELGGHSLLATQIRARLEKIFKIEIPIALIFNARTIREFSKGLLSLTGHEVNIMDTAIQFIDLANKAVGSRNAPIKDKEPNGTS